MASLTHYEVLGVEPSAPAAAIRTAYRAAARANHPDRHGEGSATRMAAINTAWQILADPVRRREYDEAIGLRGSAPHDAPAAPFVEPRLNPLARYQDPPRFPWRFMAVMATLGVAFVVLGVVTASDPVPPKVDNVLRPGDCVSIDVIGDAFERLCSEPHDGTLVVLVTEAAQCPADTEPHRDRQGMGVACVQLD